MPPTRNISRDIAENHRGTGMSQLYEPSKRFHRHSHTLRNQDDFVLTTGNLNFFFDRFCSKQLAVRDVIERVTPIPQSLRSFSNRLVSKPVSFAHSHSRQHPIGIVPKIPNWPIKQNVIVW